MLLKKLRARNHQALNRIMLNMSRDIPSFETVSLHLPRC